MATLSFDKGFGSLATGAQRKRAWTLLTSGTNLAHNDVLIAETSTIATDPPATITIRMWGLRTPTMFSVKFA